MLSTLTTSDVAVELYYFDNPQAASALNAPRHALLTAADALALYEELFGPYPYPRVVVVQGDFPDGMEFSGLVFVGDAWFKIWGGGVAEWLTVITAHEIAHQWWYAQVGSDQGRHPYLDEALSIYCELLFFERYYPENLDWWWDFRVRQYEPAGYVDAAAYDFYSVRDYINAIYLRGALMIEALRDDLGDEVFLAWLRQYAGQGRGRIMTPADLWSLLPDSQYRATEATRRAYLRQPDILPDLPAVSEIP